MLENHTGKNRLRIIKYSSQDTYSGSFFEPWTQHLYAYCNNNPISMIDPTGHTASKVNNPFTQVLNNIHRLNGDIYNSGTYGGYDGYVTNPTLEVNKNVETTEAFTCAYHAEIEETSANARAMHQIFAILMTEKMPRHLINF